MLRPVKRHNPSHSRDGLAANNMEWDLLLQCLPSPPPVLIPSRSSSPCESLSTSQLAKPRLSTSNSLELLSRKCTPAPPVAQLPDELLVTIFATLDVRSLCAVRGVCRTWRHCASDSLLWYALYVEHFADLDADAPRQLLARTRFNPTARSLRWDHSFAEQFVEEQRIARNWLSGIGRCAEYIQFQSFVRSFCFHGDQIAVGFFDGSVCAYRFGSSRVRIFKDAHLDQVVAIDVDRDCIVTGSGPPFWLDRSSVDSTVRVWNGRTDECIKVCSGHTTGIVAVKLTTDFLATAARDKTLCIWSRPGWNLLHQLHGHTGTITSLQWIVRGRRLPPILLTGSHDGTVRAWDPWTGSCIAIFAFEHFHTLSRGVRSMHYYKKQLLIGFMSGRVMLYDVDLEHIQLTPKMEYLKAGLAETRPALSVQFDNVKVAILSGDQVVRVFDYHTGRPVFNMFGLTIFASTLQVDRTRLISDGRNFIIDVHDFVSNQQQNDDPLIQVFR